MCTELEAIGLPDPVFNNSTFILKTTVMSADRGQVIRKSARIEGENARIGGKNARIGGENARIEGENARIGGENARIEGENARIGEENALIEEHDPWILAKKAWIEHVVNLREKGMMSAGTSSDVIAILEDMRENQVVGTKDIQKILDCKETKALRIINEMKKNKIIVAITGSGKGRYILNTSH